MHGSADNQIIPPALLMRAYRAGIFPMSDSRGDPDVFWVEPRKRAILPLDGFHLSRSLAKTLRRDRFKVTCDAAFDAVIQACAAPRTDSHDSWISRRIADSYRALHDLGHAHSIECWEDGKLAGGLYGVGFDRVFCGESMFSRTTDASKIALAWLVCALRRAGVQLLDCQFLTPHLASLGAVEIPQAEYLELLARAQRPYRADGASEGAVGLPEGFVALLADASDAPLAPSPGNFIEQSLTQTS